jgi:hypothetical protein
MLQKNNNYKAPKLKRLKLRKEHTFMSKKFFFLTLIFAVFTSTVVMFAANPTPANLSRPDYNYTESNGCPSCHFTSGAGGDHMLEAVGVKIDAANTVFSLSGSGWRASQHSISNFGSTQNTFCAKCHSPIEATPQATFNNGFLQNTALIPYGVVQGVTCASCHPPHGTVPRLGIYQYGKPTTLATSYQLIQEEDQDLLCLNCHVTRHNETNVAFERMYDDGVRCTDCHMAVYVQILNSTVYKKFHDFKVATNLPYSCGVDGSLSGFRCHPGFNTNSTLAFLPYMKEQHKEWWPITPGAKSSKQAGRPLNTPEDYLALWKDIQNTMDKQEGRKGVRDTQ